MNIKKSNYERVNKKKIIYKKDNHDKKIVTRKILSAYLYINNMKGVLNMQEENRNCCCGNGGFLGNLFGGCGCGDNSMLFFILIFLILFCNCGCGCNNR